MDPKPNKSGDFWGEKPSFFFILLILLLMRSIKMSAHTTLKMSAKGSGNTDLKPFLMFL